jgi:hypothetical protein
MAEESMFGIANIFDSATTDNVNIRDRALKVAQLQPGRASVYGATQAGGMLMQNLAGMAGMKTAQQEKAEIITNIMKETSNMDPNDPNTSRTLANKFIQAGFPQIGQKFIDKARSIQLENDKLALDERTVAARESDAAVNVASQQQSEYEFEKTHALEGSKFENLIYQQDRDFGLRATEQERLQAKDDYAKVQDEILNKLRQGELDISKARSALERNDFEWRQSRVNVTDAQWQKDYDIKKLLADADVAYKTEQTLGLEGSRDLVAAQTEALQLETELKNRNLQMPADGMYLLRPNEDGGSDVLKYNLDTQTYEPVTDAEGIAIGQQEAEAEEYGMSSKEQNVYDNLWDKYKQEYHTGGSMFEEGNWVEGYPDFEDWARDNAGEAGYNLVIKGQGGLRGDYMRKLMLDHNNSEESNNGETVAVVVENPQAQQGEAESNVVVVPVPYEQMSSAEDISVKVLKEKPKEINGVSNSLTNGQYITQLVQEGKETEAVLYLESLSKNKSSTLDTKMSEMEGIQGTLVKWRGKGTPSEKLIKEKQMIQRNGQWFIRKGV